MTPARARSTARGLLTAAAISAVIVLGAELIVDPIAVTAGVGAIIDALRFVGPPLALVTGLLALVHARRLERGAVRGRGRVSAGLGRGLARGGGNGEADPSDDRADAIFRGLIVVAVLLMAVGVVSALWTTLVLTAGNVLP